jgi:hypothetical protein
MEARRATAGATLRSSGSARLKFTGIGAIRAICGSKEGQGFKNPRKNFKKKACQTLVSSARAGSRATNALISSFKKKSKK